MKTRTGKIARLPKAIREDLNFRLQDGEPGVQIVQWLNDDPGVARILRLHFDGRPVNEQNLSEWKQGGYQDWLRHQEACELVEDLADQAEDLRDMGGCMPLSDRFATLLSVELVRAGQALLQETTDPRERWQRLREILRELAQLRRHDHQAARQRLAQEQRDRENDNLEQAEARNEMYILYRRHLAETKGRSPFLNFEDFLHAMREQDEKRSAQLRQNRMNHPPRRDCQPRS